MMKMFTGATAATRKSKCLTTYRQPAFHFARYFNRAENQDNQFKFDMTAYQYKPELIYKIDPAPQYPDEPMLSSQTKLERQKFKDSLEKFRDATFAKRR